MAESTKTSWNHVYVRDNDGNEAVCLADNFDHCLDDANRAIPLGD